MRGSLDNANGPDSRFRIRCASASPALWNRLLQAPGRELQDCLKGGAVPVVRSVRIRKGIQVRAWVEAGSQPYCPCADPNRHFDKMPVNDRALPVGIDP